MIRAVLCLSLSACTMLIIKPQNRPDDPTADQPIVRPPEGQCPVVGGPKTPLAHVFAFVRADRAVTAMAPAYEALLATMVAAMEVRGVTVTHTLVSAYDDASARPLVFHSCSVSPRVAVSRALPYFAAAGDVAVGCELASAAGRLSSAATTNVSVPPALLDGAPLPTSGPFFDAPPTYALVVLLDHASRGTALEACAIDGGGAIEHFAAAGIAYAPGILPADRVFFLNAATNETGEDAAKMAARCAALEGMPRTLLDVLAPSKVKSFVPLSEALTGRATFVDLCDAIAVNGVVPVTEAVKAIHAALGLPVEPLPLPEPMPAP